MGIKFEVESDTLLLYRPDGQPFADYLEVHQRLENVSEQLQQERQAKEMAIERAKRLEQLLRLANIDPDGDSIA